MDEFPIELLKYITSKMSAPDPDIEEEDGHMIVCSEDTHYNWVNMLKKEQSVDDTNPQCNFFC